MTATENSRHGHRLIQSGALLFLVSLLVGLAVPAFAVPRLALSVHLLGLMQSLYLSVVGLLWPRLHLSRSVAKATFWLALYGCVAAWTANLLGAILGAGNSIVPMAAGQARGSDAQELIIAIILRSGGAALIAAAAFVLWGLRHDDDSPRA